MKELPIIFSTDMVKAIPDGRKTVTRRVIKPQPIFNGEFWSWKKTEKDWFSGVTYKQLISDKGLLYPERTPYQKGDLLYVRESYARYQNRTIYKADKDVMVFDVGNNWKPADKNIKWKPSIHMPKWAARIWLEVIDVRAERLQEITERDAIKEGIERLFKPEDIGKPGINDLGGWKNYLWHGCAKGKLMEEWEWQYSDYSLENPNAARLSFSSLWQSLNAKRGYPWDSNPWVRRYEFKKTEK